MDEYKPLDLSDDSVEDIAPPKQDLPPPNLNELEQEEFMDEESEPCCDDVSIDSGDSGVVEGGDATSILKKLGFAIIVIGVLVIIAFLTLTLLETNGLMVWNDTESPMVYGGWGNILGFILGGLAVLGGGFMMFGMKPAIQNGFQDTTVLGPNPYDKSKRQ